MAVGLGSVDMPVPSIAEWEWLNWRFPRAVHAGDTIYARWTLTQKRPPVAGAASSIVVWRVDVHIADGTMVAEGEIGAKVLRKTDTARQRPQSDQPPAAAGTSRRRRGRRPRPNGSAPAPEPSPAAAAQPAAAAKVERPPSPSRRRRRRRSAGSGAVKDEEHQAVPASPAEAGEKSARAAPPEPAPAATAGRGGIGSVLRRLRGP